MCLTSDTIALHKISVLFTESHHYVQGIHKFYHLRSLPTVILIVCTEATVRLICTGRLESNSALPFVYVVNRNVTHLDSTNYECINDSLNIKKKH